MVKSENDGGGSAVKILLVMTNMPDQASAEILAAALIEQRVAACVNVLLPAQSVYRWKGHVESSSEVPLLIKTTVERYSMLEQAIVAGHPYELPEIVAVPVEHGLPAYLDWVATETRPLP